MHMRDELHVEPLIFHVDSFDLKLGQSDCGTNNTAVPVSSSSTRVQREEQNLELIVRRKYLGMILNHGACGK
jgi:hypothetical protein